MNRIKILLFCLFSMISVSFASIYNEDSVTINTNILNQISKNSGSVAANVTTASSKIPSITVSSGVSFSNNTTYVSGTILNSVNGILTIGNNVNFSSNTAFESGGAIYNLNLTTITVIGNNVNFSSNAATNAGGAVYSIGNLQIGKNVTFYGNKFTSTTVDDTDIYGAEVLTGGAIFQNGGSVELEKQKWLLIDENANFENNSAYKGGAIYVILSSVTISSNVTFGNNSANYRGGAVYVFNSTFTIQNGASFLSNTAKNKGGAIYAFDSVLNLNAVDKEIIFDNNTAIDGGGIYSVSSEINLTATGNKNISFTNLSSIKSTGTTVMNIKTSSLNHVFFDANINIEGGIVNLNSGEIKVGSNCATFSIGTLNLSSGTLNLSDGADEKVNLIKVTTFTATENSSLIIGISTEEIIAESAYKTVNDNFDIVKIASGVINLSQIHISSIASDHGTITLFSGGNLEDLIIKVSTKPVYSGKTYAFFQSPESGRLDFSNISTLSENSDFLLSAEINASSITVSTTVKSGTVISHLAIYGEGKELACDNGNGITISSSGALSLFKVNLGNNSIIENKNYLYAENTNFTKNIKNTCETCIDGEGETDEKDYSNDKIRLIAYNSSFSNSIINKSSVTLRNIEKEETQNFAVKVKLSSVTIGKENTNNINTSPIYSSTYIKVDTVTSTNINNKIICLIDSATFKNNNVTNGNGGAIYSGVIGVAIDSNTSNNIVINSVVEHNIGDSIKFLSNTANKSGGAIYSFNSIDDAEIDNFASVKNSSFTSTISYSIGKNVNFIGNKATNDNGGAVYNYVKQSSVNVTFKTNFLIGENAIFISNKAEKGNGGAVYNYNGTITFEDGAEFSLNSAKKGGAIYNDKGTINLTAKEHDIVFNNNKGTDGSIYDNNGTINLNVYDGRKIVFQTEKDTVVSADSTSILNINKDINLQKEAIIEINSDMSGFHGTTNIYSGFFKFGTSGKLFGGDTVIEEAIFDFSSNDSSIKNYDLSKFKINGKLNLIVDVNLKDRKMDTISSTSNSNGSGSIYIQNFNLTGNTDKSVEILFTSSMALKNKVTSSATASSAEYIYDVGYDRNTGCFTFTNRFVANPTTLETPVALLAGAMATQENVLSQAFVSMNTSFTNRHDKRLDITKYSKNLYASTENFIFLSQNKIEGGLWLRPYGYKENLTMAGYDIENTIYGALAGIDLKITDTKLLSFYIGYTGVNQKFENIKVDQNGYVFGATGMFIKESFYAGVTANVGVSDTKAESAFGSNDFQINTYTIGLKGGYEFNLSRLLSFEPNLLLMYGYMDTENYVTEHGAKISKEGFNNFRIEPQVKFNFDLNDGWKPYALLSYVYNTGETNAVVNYNKKQTQKLDPYYEYGAGLEKNFIGTAWVGFAQITGKTGGKKGVGINLGVKYAF